jgi:hypothetical protein
MSQYESEPGRSVVRYLVLNRRDYGMLTCLATNWVGPQAQACHFAIKPPGNA